MISRIPAVLPCLALLFCVSAMAGPTLDPALLPMPEIHASLVLDAYAIDDDRPTTLTTFHPGTDRIAVREASLALEGVYGDRVEYALEAGTATCQGNTNFQLLEAGIMVRLAGGLRVGYKKAHVRRGYALFGECTDQLTAEKPVYSGVLAPCHPTGCFVEMDRSLGGWEVEAQLAVLNGANGTLDGEHDVNLGATVHTPVQGVSLTGYYDDIEFLTGDMVDQAFLSGDGSRAGLGCDIRRGPFRFRAEHYWADGFPMQVIGPATSGSPRDDLLKHYEDHAMRAWYAQAGVDIPTGTAAVPSLRPYVRYQWWDRDEDSDGDAVSEYLTLGVLVPIEDTGATFRVDYETPTGTPDDLEEEAARLTARLQFSI